MNPCIIDLCCLILFMCFVITAITSIILIVRRKHTRKNVKPVASLFVTNIILLIALILFKASHSTCYKYNDWLILQSNIYMIEQKYGVFDLGTINENQAGRAAYYIYTDNKSNDRHYYYMEYDEWGVVYKVYEACQPAD